MKKLTILLLTLTILSGCFSHRPAKTLEDNPLPSQPIEEEPLLPQAPQPAPIPVSKTVSSKPSSANESDIVSVSAIPSTPAPDKPVFEDEPAFPLEGRNISPLSHFIPEKDATFAAPWQGEQLKYGIYYSFVKAGTAFIKNRGLVDINGQKAYVIQTTAFSAPVIDTVFKVRDINLSWLDARNFYSLGYSQSLREGNYRRDEWVTFDYKTNTYKGELSKKSGTRAIAGTLTKPVLDMLTSLYFVRSQNLRNGQDVIFDIINREEQYPLVVKIVGRETIKTPAGKFKCVVVEPQFRGEGIFVSKGKNLRVWLTDDDRKMPIKMKTEVFIGSVSAELLEYKHN